MNSINLDSIRPNDDLRKAKAPAVSSSLINNQYARTGQHQ